MSSPTQGVWECRHGVDGRDHCSKCFSSDGSENRLPTCFRGCGGPVHGGPCTSKTQTAPACQACLYRAAQENGLCHDCDLRERHDYYLTTGGATLLRYAAEQIRTDCSPTRDTWEGAVALWLNNLADRWSHDATGSEMDAAEHVARSYLGGRA